MEAILVLLLRIPEMIYSNMLSKICQYYLALSLMEIPNEPVELSM
jgi:hypothetical protein